MNTTEFVQREMLFWSTLTPPTDAPMDVVRGLTSYRDAVVWCWEHRKNWSGRKTDQSLFANMTGLYTPQMSRCVDRHSNAPMNLPPDVKDLLEAFCGWKVVTQYMEMREQIVHSYLREMPEQKRAAA